MNATGLEYLRTFGYKPSTEDYPKEVNEIIRVRNVAVERWKETSKHAAKIISAFNRLFPKLPPGITVQGFMMERV